MKPKNSSSCKSEPVLVRPSHAADGRVIKVNFAGHLVLVSLIRVRGMCLGKKHNYFLKINQIKKYVKMKVN